MSRSNRSTWLITRQLAETPRLVRRRLSRYWRPVPVPSLREFLCAVACYVTLGALGWSLLTADPRAAAVAGCGLLLLSKLVDRPANPSQRKDSKA
jgi:hypothetical protein